MRWLAVLCLVAGCHPEGRSGEVVRVGPRPGDPIPAGGTATVAFRFEAPEPGPAAPAARAGSRRRGASPHYGA